jgi:hypothetical protein
LKKKCKKGFSDFFGSSPSGLKVEDSDFKGFAGCAEGDHAVLMDGCRSTGRVGNDEAVGCLVKVVLNACSGVM